MWTVCLKAGQNILNEARITPELHPQERTNEGRPSRDLLKCMYQSVLRMSLNSNVCRVVTKYISYNLQYNYTYLSSTLIKST